MRTVSESAFDFILRSRLNGAENVMKIQVMVAVRYLVAELMMNVPVSKLT
jgi:hypothetical protein